MGRNISGTLTWKYDWKQLFYWKLLISRNLKTLIAVKCFRVCFLDYELCNLSWKIRRGLFTDFNLQSLPISTFYWTPNWLKKFAVIIWLLDRLIFEICNLNHRLQEKTESNSLARCLRFPTVIKKLWLKKLRKR